MKNFIFIYRILNQIKEITEMNLNQHMMLGEQKEIVLMKIVLVDKELQKAIGVENGIMIKYK